MAKLNVIKLDAHPRGDSGVIRWSWVKKESDGTLTPLSLVGYKAALTVKAKQWDRITTDIGSEEEGPSAVEGYDGTLWKIDVDCDDSTQMHGIDPAEGMILFEMPKQANWIEPGTYFMDIVVENKSSHRTTTVMLGTIEIQGHPTNRLTTDTPDTYDDITG